MLWRNSRGRPLNAAAAFIHPCQPTVAKEPPSGPGGRMSGTDGYRLQIHVRDGRVRRAVIMSQRWQPTYVQREAAPLWAKSGHLLVVLL